MAMDVPARLHQFFTAHPDGIDVDATREHPLVENLGCRKMGNGRAIKRDKISAFSRFYLIF
ncbi:hypothetical protein D3C71_2069280 [compost metagenome]